MRKYLSNKLILNLAIFAFGVQFSNSLLLANLSSLYKFLGASSSIIPYLGMAAPLSGLIIQPLIGHLSDDTVTVWGKRRPYLLFWSVLGIGACFCISFIHSLLSAVVLLWILGCSINGVTEALRALTGDLVTNNDKPAAFSFQTFFCGLGASVAVTVPFIMDKLLRPNQLMIHSLPLAIKVAFFISGIVWAFSIYWLWHRVHEPAQNRKVLLKSLQIKRPLTFWLKIKHFWQSLYRDIKNMPSIMRQLTFIQIFTWIGLYALWLYFSEAIAQHLYGLPIHYLNSDHASNLILNKSVIMTNLYFGIYQFISILYALILPWLAQKYSARAIHSASLCVGALGLLTVCITHNPITVGISMVAVGILWGSVMTLPYAIISASLPSNKMGVYLGIFNISITLPQIVAGFILPFIYNFAFFQHAIAIIMLSAISILTGAIINLYQIKHPIIVKTQIIAVVLYKNIKQNWGKLQPVHIKSTEYK